MTFGFNASANPDGYSEAVLSFKEAEDCLIPMGLTSENVANDFHISREDQDAFAASSFQKAAKAQKEGRFVPEIVPLTVPWVDAKTEKEGTAVVDHDDGVRDGVTKESLAKLKPAFTKDGTTHAGGCLIRRSWDSVLTSHEGSASQVSDGAAAVILARRSVAQRLGLPILGKFVAAAAVGVPPRIMGVGPLYAIPKALANAGLSKNDVDFFEINEAFASQALYCVRELGIDFGKVNVWGGAIALGHPLGCSACLVITACYALTVAFSWRAANRDRLEYREADWDQDIRDEHVHRLRDGHGRRVCERAVIADTTFGPWCSI